VRCKYKTSKNRSEDSKAKDARVKEGPLAGTHPGMDLGIKRVNSMSTVAWGRQGSDLATSQLQAMVTREATLPSNMAIETSVKRTVTSPKTRWKISTL